MRLANTEKARRLLAAAAIAVCAAPIAHAQADVAPAANYRIAGRVVNAATGEAVARATVNVLTEEDNHVVASALSDAEGNFAVSGLPAGKFPITAAKRGFRTTYYDEHEESFNTAMVTGPGQETEHLVFQLAPDAVIFGTVTGDGGDPVQGANVMLFRRDRAAPSRNPVTVNAVNTDDTGAYEFSDLQGGEYFVVVLAQPWYAIHGYSSAGQSSENPLDVAYPVTFFDSTTDEASATPIAVAAGERAEANITLHAVPALHLRIPRTSQNSNGPEIQVRQVVFGSDLPASSDVESVGRGPWDIKGVAPGHYELETANPPRTLQVDASSSMDIDLGSGTPSQSLDGTVRMADGSAPGDLILVLSPREEERERASLNAVASKGQFHFDAVPPGDWSLAAFHAGTSPRSLFVESITVSGSATPGDQIKVRNRPLSIAVTLATSQAHVEGFASRDGKAAPGAMIVLVPANPAAYPSLVRRDQSDSDGSFSLRDIPPGRYTVVAIVDGWKLDWQDRAVIARYLPRGQPVTIDTHAGGAVRLPRPVEAVSP